MDGQQTPIEAKLLAGYLKDNNLDQAADRLQQDSVGTNSAEMFKLITQTNTNAASSEADQLRLGSKNGLPIVEFVNKQGNVDKTVTINISDTAPVAAAAPAPPPSDHCKDAGIAGAGAGFWYGGPIGAGIGYIVGKHGCKAVQDK